ncbi:Hpt domain-containing protein [Methyloligella sp. 2.7D]|uniref:Hpt domain-containing protein n=1 Tax=unclassified Methyloligella TaxID=2625955 RepID=UPI00157CBC0F|nr:Hpt domain-containing protein [Methyloligella sp. GL2]QKP77315.1 Hpt domain-containing protein [Methyloligella sp. GL2]
MSRSARAAIERAKAAVEALSPAFKAWLAEEVEALQLACEAAEAEDFSLQSRQGIFLSAHTLKGQAPTLGYPEVAKLAASLCRLLNYWLPEDGFKQLATAHVKAIAEAAQDASGGNRDQIAESLKDLREQTADLLGPMAQD